MKNRVRENYLAMVEDQSRYSGGAFFRPDTSGIRGKGVNRKAYPGAGDEFPYDGTSAGSWGEPWAYSRDSAGHGGSRQNVNVPKGVSDDDDRWKNEIGGEGWTSGTPVHGNIAPNEPRSKSKFGIPGEKTWPDDEETMEAIGVPFNLAKSGQGTGGPHGGGRTMPGTSGDWSARPKGGVWDQFVDDDDLEKAGKTESLGGLAATGNVQKVRPGAHDVDTVPSAEVPDDEDEQPQLSIGGAKFGSTGNARKYSRMQPGMTWKESFHRAMVEAYVSLKATPHGIPEKSKTLRTFDKELVRDAFRLAHVEGSKRFDEDDEPTIVKFMMRVDPDRFANSLGKIGKQSLRNIYDMWRDDLLSKGSDELENAAERIRLACDGEEGNIADG